MNSDQGIQREAHIFTETIEILWFKKPEKKPPDRPGMEGRR
jgi:hypothetical protein